MLKTNAYLNYISTKVTAGFNVRTEPENDMKLEDMDPSNDLTHPMNASPVLDRGFTKEEKDFHASTEEIIQAIRQRNRDYKALMKSEEALQKAMKR